MDFWPRARSIARRARHEMIHAYAGRDWTAQFVKQLELHRVDVVLDVGANSGQYATGVRRAGFTGRIVSFEPLSGPFSVLTKKASRDPLWECRRSALGDSDGVITINVAGNAGLSSSVLPMLASHQDAYPPAKYVGIEEVPLRRLDSVAPEVLGPTDRAFLKVDVQGFEKQVLAGGAATVAERCAGLQVELSFLPLYDGGPLVRETVDLAYSLGFELTGMVPGFTDIRSGRMLQADGIFFRADG